MRVLTIARMLLRLLALVQGGSWVAACAVLEVLVLIVSLLHATGEWPGVLLRGLAGMALR